MKSITRSMWIAIGLAAAMLQGCGGGSDSTGSGTVRLINATQTHSSLDLLASSSKIISATATDAASAYVSQTAGSITMQVSDAGDSTSVALATTVIVKDLHYTLLAYEVNGTVKLASLGEDVSAPTSGTAQLHVFDAAYNAGAVDVYVTDTSTDLSTVSPTFTIGAASYAQSSTLVSFAPGTYRVRVTAADNKSDLRLDMPTITLTNQEVATIVLTPAAGANLINGGLLVQQGAFTPARNTNARVRLVAAVSGSPTVAASAGSSTIESGVTSPSVGTYAMVPVANALSVTVNGTAVSTSALSLAAGTDVSLMVHGTPTAATATAIVDDNFLSSTTTKLKMRLVNGTTGTSVGLNLITDFSLLASNIQPGAASTAGMVTANSAMRVEVTSAVTQSSLYLLTGQNIAGSSVYTVFMLGDSAAPVGVVRKDR